ncbi:MAG: N-acyl homoserine lactonase family protein [Bacillota bacterium]
MEVYAINTGYIKMKSGFYLFPGLKDENRYPVLVFLIKINDKTILFDTGISQKIENRMGVFGKFLFLENLQENSLDKQLETLGVKVDAIDYIINSHLHFDHCSNNYMFSGKPILIQKKEHINFLEAKKNPMYIQFLEDEAVTFEYIEGDHVITCDDVIVRLHAAYGHSEGHQILTVESESSFLMFLADSCYVKDGTLKPIEVEDMKSYNTSLATVNWINSLMKQNKNKKIRLFHSHDFNFKKDKLEDCECVYGEIEKYEFI